MPLNLLAAADVLRTVGSVLLAILILLAMITVHECGHYLAGRLLRFRIQEFSVGFGPALFKRTKKNGEVFALRLIPLGGYCAFAGEEEEEGKEALPGAFYRQKPWRRVLVLLAGAAMNYLFALLLIILSFFACGQLQFMAVRVQPAATSFETAHSLQEGDVILACEGRDVYLVSDLMQALEGKEAGDWSPSPSPAAAATGERWRKKPSPCAPTPILPTLPTPPPCGARSASARRKGAGLPSPPYLTAASAFFRRSAAPSSIPCASAAPSSAS